MKIDIYTKILLTFIAVALSLIALNPWLNPPEVEARQGDMDVRIVGITSTALYLAEPIEVKITNWR